MGILKNEVSRQFLAQPDTAKNQIVYKWPDQNIRKGARAIVEADHVMVFMNKGEVLGTLGPGQHKLDADEIMFLGIVIDWATDGNAYRAESYFVGTKEWTGETFGGRIDNVQDPQTGLIITLRVFGEYSMQVIDPSRLILNLTGTVDVSNNDAIGDWIDQQLLKTMRTEITRQIVRNGWPILGLSAYTPEIEQACITAANQQLAEYGMTIVRMGNFDVNLDDEDEERLKGLAKDTAYSRLAGSYQNYAAGSAMIGAGEGFSKGGGGLDGAFLGVGMGMAGNMNNQQLAQPAAPPPAPGFPGGGGGYAAAGTAAGPAVACPNCNASNAPGAKFCANCGQAMGQRQFCTNCGAEMAPGARFCGECGTPVGAPEVPAAVAPAAVPPAQDAPPAAPPQGYDPNQPPPAPPAPPPS
ncbi:MAG: SPFH domain-containing protein [Actinobacteria bacterium]|nr:SPFH domain-containing protein [Actinomycetota bacterium]